MPNSKLERFLRDRSIALALIVLVMFLIALTQAAIAYTLILGGLRSWLLIDIDLLAAADYAARIVLLLAMVALWFLGWKHALMRSIVALNALFTVVLLVHTAAILQLLAGLSTGAVDELIADIALMAVSNVLIFSIWYWIIDPPGVIEDEPDPHPWAFLFPQRASVLPHYESWIPGYGDYLFIAFTTSFAFSPTDAVPLSRPAKLLMVLQSAISVITLTGMAGSAINILAR